MHSPFRQDDLSQVDYALIDTAITPAVHPHKRAAAFFHWITTHLIFMFIFCIAVYLITINVRVGWQANYEVDGEMFTAAAINHIRYGLGFTKGQDWIDAKTFLTFGPHHPASEPQDFYYFLYGPEQPALYGHHPPALGLTIAASFLAFSYHFWAVRLVPIAYSLGGLILFYFLVSWMFDVGAARIASALYATYPMMAFYGRNVAQEAPVLFWALLLLISYFKWRETGARSWLLLAAAAVAIGSYYDWPMIYFAVILFVIDWIAQRKPNWRLFMSTAVVAVIMFVLIVAQIAWAAGGKISFLMGMFLFRASGGGPNTHITTLAWLNQVASLNAEGFGQWTQYVLPVVAVFVLRRASLEGWSPRVQLIVTLVVWGVFHVLLFRDGAYVHTYWQFYLMPFFALITGWAAMALVRAQIPTPWLRGVALATMLLVVVSLNVPIIINLYGHYLGTHPVTPVFDFWH